MATPKFPKTIHVTFTGASTGDPVTVTNNRTKERINKQENGKTLKLEGRKKSIVVDMNNFKLGYLVGDAVTVSLGGAKVATVTIILTAASAKPQEDTVVATAASTAVTEL